MVTLSVYTPSSIRSSAGRPVRFGYLSAVVRTLVDEFRAHRAARNVEALSDEMLRDIGVSRSEIDLAVRYGRGRRF